MEVEIKCINKKDRDNAWERITNIWWVNYDWTNWKMTQQKAIDYIKSGTYNFFVNVKWDYVKVIVSTSSLFELKI